MDIIQKKHGIPSEVYGKLCIQDIIDDNDSFYNMIYSIFACSKITLRLARTGNEAYRKDGLDMLELEMAQGLAILKAYMEHIGEDTEELEWD